MRVAGPTGEFLPDIQDRNNPGVTVADNVLPHVSGYKAARGLNSTNAVLVERARGATTLRSIDGVTHSYAGDETTLYELISGSYVDVGQTYALADPRQWWFTRFNDSAFAANGIDPIQVHVAMAGTFSDIVPTVDVNYPVPDPAPPAQYLAEANNFLITGWQSANQTKIQWSALGDYTIWDPGRQQAGEQILNNGGRITQIIGGEYGVVFCERSIYRMNYTGDPDIVFQIQEIAPGRGTLTPGSVVQYADVIYYIDTDGFYVFNGSISRGIGSNKLNDTFIADYDLSNAHRVTSAVDVKNSLVYWAYPSNNAPAGQPDKIIVYDILTGKFAGPLNVSVEILFYGATDTGILLDEFLADNAFFSGWDVLPDGTPDFDSNQLDMDNGLVLGVDVDDGQFKGGQSEMVAFNAAHKLSTFTGSILKSRIESAEVNFILGGRALLTGFRALVEGVSPNVRIQVGWRDKTSGPVTWTSELTPNNITELADTLIDARYHRFRISVDGDYEFIFGGEPEYEEAGFF